MVSSQYQSGFDKHHSALTTAVEVVNDIIEALNGGKCCATLFRALPKTFDRVQHVVLADKLHKIGLSNQAVNWVFNSLAFSITFVIIYAMLCPIFIIITVIYC